MPQRWLRSNRTAAPLADDGLQTAPYRTVRYLPTPSEAENENEQPQSRPCFRQPPDVFLIQLLQRGSFLLAVCLALHSDPTAPHSHRTVSPSPSTGLAAARNTNPTRASLRRVRSRRTTMAMNFVTFNQDYSCLAVGALLDTFHAIFTHCSSPRYLSWIQDIPHGPVCKNIQQR